MAFHSNMLSEMKLWKDAGRIVHIEDKLSKEQEHWFFDRHVCASK